MSGLLPARVPWLRMRPGYGRLLLYQGLLSLASTTGGTFVVVFYLDGGGSVRPPLTLFTLGFASAAIGVWAMCRLRPRNSFRLMAAGLLAYASCFPLILLLPKDVSPFVAFAGWGLSIPLFYLPLNTLAAELAGEGDRAVTLGGLFLTFAVVGIFGPSLGGLLVSVGGYGLAFGFAGTALVFDAGLLLAATHPGRPLPFRIDLRRLPLRPATGLFLEGGAEGALAIAIPFATFSFVQEPRTLGLLFSLFALAGGVTTILLARVSDRIRERRRFVVVGALLAGASMAGISLSGGLAAYVLAMSAMQLTWTIAPLFLFTTAVDRFPDRKGDAIATREVLLNVGRVLGLVAVAALYAAGLPPVVGFAVAGSFALGMAVG